MMKMQMATRFGAALVTLGLVWGAAASTAYPKGADAAAASGDLAAVWSMETDCAACHRSEADSLEPQVAAEPQAASEATDRATAGQADASAVDATFYAADHAAAHGFTCATCHEESAGLAKAHERMDSGKTARRLRRTEVSSEPCTACHKAEDLKKATEDCTVLVDSRGTTVNPHDLPAGEDHGKIACVDCHTVHVSQDASLDDNALRACTSCHHQGVFECGTCHH